MDFFSILWLIFILSSLQPMIRQRVLLAQRISKMREFEKKRGSRVIAMIHRQEAINFLGIPIARYIDIQDSEQVLRAIKMTDDNVPIDFILHTPGGLVLAAEQIAMALLKHKAKVTVFVPHYAMSGGTLISLAADEIVMDDNAVLGPVDPQLGQYAAASILKVVEQKPIAEIDDQTLILADLSRKAINQVVATVERILADKMTPEQASAVAQKMATGVWTHDYPIMVDEARSLGLPVSTDMPDAIHELMALYPQPQQQRPSVQYIPMPYERKENNKSRSLT
ncbi:MAG: hypothetical protein D6790_19670 [Caldilineae bacterium]|nr:MAG: hypothetical protein D6790_19670 [Caldilineae bacterium]